jgi:PEP-CTERM/exosortase A-associated glycosyltransferase
MHILHVLDHSIPLHSGYTFRTRNILLQQRALGWQTSHITSTKQGPVTTDFECIDGLDFYRTPLTNNLLSRIPLMNQAEVIRTLRNRLVEVVAQVQPDVIHAHSPALNGLAAISAARKFNIPVVYECRAFWEDAAVDHGTSRESGLRYRLTRAMETRVFQQADAVTTICEGLKGDIEARGIEAGKITVIPNAVDTSHFAFDKPQNAALGEKLGLTGKTVLGFIGSFYGYEGIPLIVQALPTLLVANPNIALLLVGGGPDEDYIRSEARRLNVEHAIVFTGRVPHNEVDEYYSLVDILVYPRLSMRLTDLVTPLKPLEAMAQGKLMVASDVGGHRELIKHNKTGVLFTANSVAGLAEAVQQLMTRQGDWQQMREAGRHYVDTERNWQNSVARYQAIYNALL